ncbi:MAG: exonuclease domain-containing protein, partial [bacterium]
MNRWIAFDVETPNRYNDRMSAIGVAVIEDGRVTEEFASLVNPEEPFDWFNTRLTGLDSAAVAGAPTFAQLWPRLEPLFSSGTLAAHNASFDMGVLRRCLRDYGIYWKPGAEAVCTVVMGRRLLPGLSHKLDALCDYYSIPLDHHRA